MVKLPATILRYGVALVAVALALLITVNVGFLVDRSSLALLFAAVIIAVWYGGWGPGLLAAALSVIGGEYFIIPPRWNIEMSWNAAFPLLTFIPLSLLLIWLTAGFQRREKALRLSEATLRESEARILDVFGNCPVAVLVSRWTDRTFVDVNHQFTRLTGWRREDVIGRTAMEVNLVDENDAAELRARLEEKQSLSDKEVRIRTKDGETRYVIMGTVFVDMRGERHAITTFVDIMARKLAEEARRAGEVRLRIVTENARVGLVMVDDQRHYTFANAAYADILGLPSAEIVGQRVADILSSVYDEQVRPRLDRAFAGERVSYELHRPADDGDRYYFVSYEPLMAGEVVSHVVVVITDITQRKLAELARSASEGRYRTLFEYSPDGILIADPASYYLDANETMCRMLGYSLDELVGMHGSDIVALEEMQYIEKALDNIKETSEHRREWIFRRKDGTRFAGEVVATNMPDGNLLAVVRDVTLRKQEAAARDSLAAIVESSDDAIISKDLNGLVTSWNPAAEKMFGYTSHEMFGKPILRIIPPERLDEEPDIIARIGRGEVTDHFETVRIGKDKVPIDVSITISPIRAVDGKIVGASKIVRNITEKKLLEAQLLQSQKMEAVGMLAGGIAHDFNNLLTAIIGYSELTLKRMPPDDLLRNNIKEIKEAGERAASLTGQLLAFSRKQILRPKVHNLNSVIEQLEQMLRRIINENIDFRLVLDPELGNIRADPGQMEQVIMNLVVNARDAMPDGGRLTIETHNIYLDKDYVSQHIEIVPGPFIKMTLTDSGKGIDEETKKHIFDPFFTTKEVGKGTGLGLSTVYGIVKQSGGDIMVYSEVGHGTTFKIYIPCVDEEVRSPELIDIGNDYSGTETILLVEDEEVLRKLAREILKNHGYQVLEAVNGMAAFSICETYPEQVHLILTDVIMPKMSGNELKTLVTKLHPDIKILFMSGYTDDLLLNSGILDSEVAFIEKPFAPDDLARKVREVLES